jgi:hypothetical protein
MTVKIWSSYSCNNSSSYRIVARFASPQAAEAVAATLREFFPVHAAEVDQRDDYSEEPSEAQLAMGAQHGFTWGESLYWGDDGLVDDEPDVFVRNEILIVQHTYCGGLGELTGLLQHFGASDADQQDERAIDVSLLFRAAPGANPELDAELDNLFVQFAKQKANMYSELKPPWAAHETYGKTAHFRDSGTVGIYLPVDPRDLAALDTWLADHQLDKPSLMIEERGDLAAFEAIAKATCTACSGKLDYLDPRIHDIETPQLVCKPCGGLYEVSTFLAAP